MIDAVIYGITPNAKIEKFCNINRGKCIDFNEIKNKYLECNPRYVSEKFMKIIEK